MRRHLRERRRRMTPKAAVVFPLIALAAATDRATSAAPKHIPLQETNYYHYHDDDDGGGPMTPVAADNVGIQQQSRYQSHVESQSQSPFSKSSEERPSSLRGVMDAPSRWKAGKPTNNDTDALAMDATRMQRLKLLMKAAPDEFPSFAEFSHNNISSRVPSTYQHDWKGRELHGAEAFAMMMDSESDGARSNTSSSVGNVSDPSWSEWSRAWSSLSISDLEFMAYDSSSLNKQAHRAWGGSLLGRRRTSTDADNGIGSGIDNGIGNGSRTDRTPVDADELVWEATSRGADIDTPASFLRGNLPSATRPEQEQLTERQQLQGNGRPIQRQYSLQSGPENRRNQARRKTSTWTTHGPDNQPLPGDPDFVPLPEVVPGHENDQGVNVRDESDSAAETSAIDGILHGEAHGEFAEGTDLDSGAIAKDGANVTSMTFFDIQSASTGNDENDGTSAAADDAERKVLLARLQSAIETTQRLERTHPRYDPKPNAVHAADDESNMYSWIPKSPDTNPNNNNNNDNDNDNDNAMTPLSNSYSQRQRLLTASYAAWQWYDRNSLATPTNLELDKVSRINYAFFQTDANGYIFGTDSWADPNVLFGPYDFTTSTDRLPEECKGGKGRDDGSPSLGDDRPAGFSGFTGSTGSAGNGDSGGVNTLTESTGITSGGVGNGTDVGSGMEDDPDDETEGNIADNGSRKLQDGDKPCDKFEQCHRNFPNSKSCNIHKHKEGLIYLSHTAGAQIYPSIGGWTLSGSFPAVAADPEKRAQFAKECVGLIADYGFDGIDIDWEYPGYEPHGGSPKDRENFNKLLLEVREALNEYQLKTGDEPIGGGTFGLSAALPCGPANIEFLDVSFLSQVLSGLNLMSFDFHNEMDPVTGVNAPLYYQGWGEEDLSVDGCVKNYFEAGAALVPAKISIGIPFYGRTFSYASNLNSPHSKNQGKGAGQADIVNWPQDLGTPVFYNLLEKFAKGVMLTKRHETSKTQYAFFKDGSGLVSYDDPQAVCDKVEYVNQNFLGGVFVWELSGDLTADLETPLVDAINRKMDELNFDCKLIASPEDGSLVPLPPPAPKGPAQVVRREDESIAQAVKDHLNRVEAGELSFQEIGFGSFSRTVFVFRTYDGSLFPSYVYRFEHFLEALIMMSTNGVDGDLFYLGNDQDATEFVRTTPKPTDSPTPSPTMDQNTVNSTESGSDEGNSTESNQFNGNSTNTDSEAAGSRRMQAKPGKGAQEAVDYTNSTTVMKTSIVYGLVNIAAYLSQAMADSIIHDACDELNIQHLPADDKDNRGLDDGNDEYRFPVSNACGSNGRNYQDEQCPLAKDSVYDCISQLNANDVKSMEVHGTSRGQWGGAPGPFYCGPKSIYGTTGFWDAIEGREVDDVPTPNDFGRNDVEGCCWWGRGSLQIKGTCLYGKLNYHIGENKALRDGRETAMFPDINFCTNPGEICSGSKESIQLRWITGMYHWMENVQKYNETGFNYKAKLVEYVNNNLIDENFIKMVSSVHLLGCHEEKCNDRRAINDMDDRVRNFEKVLTSFGLQFGTYATAEPPFNGFPGQIPPTSPPTIKVEFDTTTTAPTSSPTTSIETVTTQVNVFLTGVTPDVNMTVSEVLIFEQLMLDLLRPRLSTVDIVVDEVIVDSQYPGVDYTFNSQFDSMSGDGGEELSVLQTVLNVTLTFYPPPPDGWRDWSIYLKSWIESFGVTIVEIFKSPKHPQHPDTNSKFWDKLIDVSATNVPPPRNITTEIPTPPPTFIIYPEPDPSDKFVVIGAASAAVIALLFFIGFFTWKLYQRKQRRAALLQKLKEQEEKDKEQYFPSAPMMSLFDAPPKRPGAESESSSESSSSPSSSSSSSSQEESRSQSDSDVSDDEEIKSVYTNNDFSRASGSNRSYSTSVYSVVTDDEEREHLDAIGEDESSDEDLDEYHEESEESEAESEESEAESEESDEEPYGGDTQEQSPQDIPSPMPMKSTYGSDDLGDIIERIKDNDQYLTEVILDNRNIGRRHDAGEALFNALARNHHVTHLSLRNNELDDEAISSLSLALVENKSITHVYLGDNFISDEGVEYLIGTLGTNNSIIHLDLEGILITNPQLLNEIQSILKSRLSGDSLYDIIDRVAADDPALEELILSGMRIGARDDATTVFDSLAVNTTIHYLDLSNNEIDDECVSAISLALCDNVSITHINLRNNKITSEGAEYLIGTLDSNKMIKEISLEGNIQIDLSILQEINDILAARKQVKSRAGPSVILDNLVLSVTRNDPDLVELKLDGVQLLNIPEAEELIDALSTNFVVKSVSFNGTGMDDTMVAALSLSLAENKTITHVSLKDNRITSEGCEYLLGTLDSNLTITNLDLRGNQVDPYLLNEIENIVSSRLPQSPQRHAGVGNSRSSRISLMDDQPLSVLLQRLTQNDPSLTELWLDNRDLSNLPETEPIFDALANNSYVTKLSLIGCGIDDGLVASLSLALVENTSIMEIWLSDNLITSGGCEYLLGTLDTNETIEFIDLEGNEIEPELIDEIQVAMSKNSGLTRSHASRERSFELS